ncbi:MAG: GGDEF domain-containing protein [Nakamurella sp.]
MAKERPTDVRGSFAICSIVDISIERAEQHRLQNLARFDPMTGLLNRAAIVEELQQLCVAAQAGGDPGAVFFCDLDQFKGVNDRHGHAVGDRVLQDIAARLLLTVPGYAVGRFGGDEFLVVAGGTVRSQAESTAERLRRVLDEPEPERWQ